MTDYAHTSISGAHDTRPYQHVIIRLSYFNNLIMNSIKGMTLGIEITRFFEIFEWVIFEPSY